VADNSWGLKIGIEGEKEFKNALKEINQSFKVLGSEMNLVTSQFDKQDKSLQAITARNAVLNKEIDAQKNKISTLEAALKNASDSFGETDRRTQNWAIQLNNAKADLNKMEKELDNNNQAIHEMEQGFDEAEEGAGRFADSVNQAAKQTEDASGKFEKLGGVLKGIGAAIAATVVAIGSAAIATGASLIKLGDEYNMAVNQISASTGATGQELEALGEVAQNVYKHNFGDSLEDVANGISEVSRTTGLMGQELEKATESGFALRDTFGFEMQESARAAGALIKNFGISADEAYNIIAVGAQNGADKNGDLLDTLNEYSAQYAALGLSADEFIAGLIGGAEAGAFSIDKIGDAVKEFNIRAKDGSSGTIEAFSALGFSADEMSRKFAQGGETASEAFYAVIARLNEIEDPLLKNTIGVQLFGTQFEDLEANVLPVLAGMKDSTLATSDALAQITEVKYDNLSAAMEGVKRSLQGVFLPAVSEVSAGITDLFSELSNGINAAEGDFDKISEVIGETVGGITSLITEQLPQFVTLGLDIVMALGGAIIENLPIIIDSAMQIVMTLLTALIEALPQITEGALYLVLALVEGIIANLPSLVEAALMMIVTLATGIGEALPELVPSIVQAIILIVETIIANLDLIFAAAFQIMQGLATGLINALPTLIEALPSLIMTIVSFIVSNIPQIIQMGVQLTVSLAAGLIQAIPQLVAQLPQIVAAIITGIGKAAVSIVEIGRNIIQGLWNGISSMLGWIQSKVNNMVNGIVRSMKGVLGIRSPSKVFAGIGENMGQGIGEGFSSAMKDVEKEMAGAIPTDFDLDMNSVVSGVETGSSGAVFDVTIPLTIDGNILTRVIAQLQWNQNTVTVRNLGVAGA
jgi:phage-related minor tail protein